MPFDTSDAERKDAVLCDAIKDMRPAMEGAIKIVADGIETNFRSESSAGEKWAPLRPSTVEQRERKGFGGEHPILNRTSALKNVASAHRKAMRDGAEVGPDDSLPYARVHADGSEDGRILARDYLAQTDLTIDAIDREIQSFLEEHDG